MGNTTAFFLDRANNPHLTGLEWDRLDRCEIRGLSEPKSTEQVKTLEVLAALDYELEAKYPHIFAAARQEKILPASLRRDRSKLRRESR